MNVNEYRAALRKELEGMCHPGTTQRTWSEAEVFGMMTISDTELEYLMQFNTPKELAEVWSQ